ncbi:MAG: hypothetical protein ACLQF1_12700 [Methyloceanibacter sp.]|jgi:hypothetical protein
MKHEDRKSTRFGTSSPVRFGPWLGAALLLGLAMPLNSVSAGVPGELRDPAGLDSATVNPALPSEAAKASDGGAIVVADKHNNKNWNNKKVVVVRPYRHWSKRPYYGTVIGGVALGTILGAAAYSAAAPAPNLCWYWADPSMTRGYWDYCQ